MVQELREFYERYVAAANARDFETIAGLIHDDVMVNGVARKRDDVLASLASFTEIVPDFTWHIEDLAIAKDRISARLRDTGTPTTAWLGVAPTDTAIEFTELASYRVRQGRFSEMWFLMDTETAKQQLSRSAPELQ